MNPTRLLVLGRAGYVCEVCEGTLEGVHGHSLHHRRPRGMGGSKDPATHTAANFLAVCGSGTTGCHGWIEQHRALAYASGLLVRRGHDPAATPVVGYRGDSSPVWLCDEGHVHDTPDWEHE